MSTRATESRALTRALKSHYWRESEARAVLGAWARSGESAAVFAQRHGLAASRLLRWKSWMSSSDRRPVFHPVKVIGTGSGSLGGAAAAETGGALELVVGGERRILVRRGFDPEVLAELVRAVESWEC